MSLLRERQRRNVIRVSVGYGALSWLLLPRDWKGQGR